MGVFGSWKGIRRRFFVPTDANDLSYFLDELPGPYYIIEDAGTVIACGGWAMDNKDTAALTWGMVRRDQHRKGIGRLLLHHRLNAIREDGRAKIVRIRPFSWFKGSMSEKGSKSLTLYRTDMEKDWIESP